MSRLVATIDQELADFQALLAPLFLGGAVIEFTFEPDFEPGVVVQGPSLVAAGVKVQDVGLGPSGPLYLVFFGAVHHLRSDDQPSDFGLTALVADPLVDLRNGSYVLQQFTSDGAPLGTWLRITPACGRFDIDTLGAV